MVWRRFINQPGFGGIGGGLGRTGSSAPTEGLRFFTGLCLSPPHPSRPGGRDTFPPRGRRGGWLFPFAIQPRLDAFVTGADRVVRPYGGCRGRLPFDRGLGVSAAGWAEQSPAPTEGVEADCHLTVRGGCRCRVGGPPRASAPTMVWRRFINQPGFGGIGGGLGRTGSSAPTEGLRFSQVCACRPLIRQLR